jgi:hypothetical protein
MLLAAFNLIYVLPLIVIAVLPAVAGLARPCADRPGTSGARSVAPAAVAVLTAVMGGGLILRGADGLLG